MHAAKLPYYACMIWQ